jgi:hypothetical protein
MQFLKLIQLDSGIVEFLVGFYNRSMDNFICACFFFNRGYPGQLIRTSTNFLRPEINDNINFQWS